MSAVGEQVAPLVDHHGEPYAYPARVYFCTKCKEWVGLRFLDGGQTGDWVCDKCFTHPYDGYPLLTAEFLREKMREMPKQIVGTYHGDKPPSYYGVTSTT